MVLRTLHSDRSTPEQLLGAYVCPECQLERRLPLQIEIGQSGGLNGGEGLASMGAR
jgi:hypothetical protein